MKPLDDDNVREIAARGFAAVRAELERQGWRFIGPDDALMLVNLMPQLYALVDDPQIKARLALLDMILRTGKGPTANV